MTAQVGLKHAGGSGCENRNGYLMESKDLLLELEDPVFSSYLPKRKWIYYFKRWLKSMGGLSVLSFNIPYQLHIWVCA
jgi:hypothetical protein